MYRNTLALIAVCVTGIALCTLIVPTWWRTDGLMDATSFRCAAELVGTPGLYDYRAVRQIQQENIGQNTGLRVFLRHPWYALAVRWIAWPPYSVAVAAWKVALLIAAILFVVVSPWDRKLAAIAITWSLPAVTALEQGQDTVLLLLCAAAVITLARRRRDGLAGLVLSLCTIKFHFLVFLPFVIITRKRYSLAAGFVAGIALLYTISVAVQGTNWPREYLDLLATPNLHSANSVMPTVAGMAPLASYPARALIFLAGFLLVGAVVWRISRQWPFDLAFASAVAGGVIIAPHAYLQDAVLVIPLAAGIITISHKTKWVAAFLLSPLSCILLAMLSTHVYSTWIQSLAAAAFVIPTLLILVTLSREDNQKPDCSAVACGADASCG